MTSFSQYDVIIAKRDFMMSLTIKTVVIGLHVLLVLGLVLLGLFLVL